MFSIEVKRQFFRQSPVSVVHIVVVELQVAPSKTFQQVEQFRIATVKLMARKWS